MSPWVLPEAMVAAGTVSAVAVGGDLWMNGSVDPKNILAAYRSGALTRYTGFKSTVLINAGSGAITSYMDGKNPFLYGTIGGLGGTVGYGVGNKFIEPMLGDVVNPTLKTLQWKDRPSAQPYNSWVFWVVITNHPDLDWHPVDKSCLRYPLAAQKDHVVRARL
ncbi:hypothetical protein P3N87_004885 [Salmonella enterica]|nr:hypothetical protein [Salmonella enterica]